MTKNPIEEFLDWELSALPERTSGAEVADRARQLAARFVTEDRPTLVEALRNWLRRREEPRTMLAVTIAAHLALQELRPDILELLQDVRAGRALWPEYARRIVKALARL